MKKSTKKEIREAQEKAALRQRVRDIACGAAGYNFDKEDEYATAEFLERFVCAIRDTFGSEKNAYMWQPHCLAHFNDINSTTSFLWEHRHALA
jgi:hypothetical protein